MGSSDTTSWQESVHGETGFYPIQVKSKC